VPKIYYSPVEDATNTLLFNKAPESEHVFKCTMWSPQAERSPRRGLRGLGCLLLCHIIRKSITELKSAIMNYSLTSLTAARALIHQLCHGSTGPFSH